MDPQRAIIQQLESLKRAGVTHLPKIPVFEPPRNPPAATPENRAVAVAPSSLAPVQPPAPTTTSPPRMEPPMPKRAAKPKPTTTSTRTFTPQKVAKTKRQAALNVIDAEVKSCTRCKELAAERTNTVFGVGDPNARICFFGEAPGADEDQQGEPFVGRAGKLLNKIIEACTFSREEVYILNTLKCRPPGNRNPAPDEACNCREYFERQLEIIAPDYIVCLGTISSQILLETKVSIGRLRGEFHDFHGMKVLATYHPAYLLRNPSAKKDVWKDMQFLMRDMGVKVPRKM